MHRLAIVIRSINCPEKLKFYLPKRCRPATAELIEEHSSNVADNVHVHSLRRPRQLSTLALVLLVIASILISLATVNLMNTQSKNKLFTEVKKHIAAGDAVEAAKVLGEWHKKDKNATKDERYTAALDEVGRILSDPVTQEIGHTLTIQNIMARGGKKP